MSYYIISEAILSDVMAHLYLLEMSNCRSYIMIQLDIVDFWKPIFDFIAPQIPILLQESTGKGEL